MKRNRVHNFSAGPAQLPLEVLEEVRDELTNYKNIGSSIIEISHRDKTFVDLATESEAQLRKLLNLDDSYEIIFMQGGATLQFSLIPINFIKKKEKAVMLRLDLGLQKQLRKQARSVMLIFVSQQRLIILLKLINWISGKYTMTLN